VRMGWQFKSVEEHAQRVTELLHKAGAILRAVPSPLNASDASAISMDQLPREGDPFFLATDERDPSALAHLRSLGAVLIFDLLPLDKEDDPLVESLGPAAFFGDTLSIVEQALLARSAFFVGDDQSSVDGGVLNMRAAAGIHRSLTAFLPTHEALGWDDMLNGVGSSRANL